MHPRVLGIDFGTVRIGLAISRGSLAEPMGIVAHDERVIDRLREICLTEKIEKIVFGLSENTMAELTQQFAARVRDELSLPVEFMDETLSSHSVLEKLRTAGKTGPHRVEIDDLAAAEVLQEWLDQQV